MGLADRPEDVPGDFDALAYGAPCVACGDEGHHVDHGEQATPGPTEPGRRTQ
jgi:hypothetical protein